MAAALTLLYQKPFKLSKVKLNCFTPKLQRYVVEQGGAAQSGREGGELEFKDGKGKSITGQHRSLPGSLALTSRPQTWPEAERCSWESDRSIQGALVPRPPPRLPTGAPCLGEGKGLCSTSAFASTTSYTCDKCHKVSLY